MPRGRGRMDSARRLTVRRQCVVRVLHDNTGLSRARVYRGGGAIACARACVNRVDDLHPLSPLPTTATTLNRPSSEYRPSSTKLLPLRTSDRGETSADRDLSPPLQLVPCDLLFALRSLPPAVSLRGSRGVPDRRYGCVQERSTSSVYPINTVKLSQRSVT